MNRLSKTFYHKISTKAIKCLLIKRFIKKFKTLASVKTDIKVFLLRFASEHISNTLLVFHSCQRPFVQQHLQLTFDRLQIWRAFDSVNNIIVLIGVQAFEQRILRAIVIIQINLRHADCCFQLRLGGLQLRQHFLIVAQLGRQQQKKLVALALVIFSMLAFLSVPAPAKAVQVQASAKISVSKISNFFIIKSRLCL